jgi:thiopeptide-type bacteriocin biosynthesis protein
MGKLQEMLDTSFFRSALYFASIELYQQVKSKDFRCDRLSERICQSLFKYFNRMCYRPTPFGMCSAFSVLDWSESRDGIRIDADEKLHIRIDFRLSAALSGIAEGMMESDHLVYYSNPGVYTFGKELRYIKTIEDGEGTQKAHGIAAIEKDQLLCRLLRRAQRGIRKSEFHAFLNGQATDEEAEELFQGMIAEELLLNSLQANITGEGYLNRLAKLSGSSELADFASAIDEPLSLEKVNVAELDKCVGPFLNYCGDIRHPFYVNFQREVEGSLDQRYQEIILSGLDCLSIMRQSVRVGSISRFIKEYTARFEDREIPLLLALDPEGGIGYGQLEQSLDNVDLLKGISFSTSSAEKQIVWGPVQEFLMRKILWSAKENQSVLITEQDLKELPDHASEKYAPGISVMFRMVEGKVFIEEAGGVCSTSLTGRFTPFDERVRNQARELAKAEQLQNKEVIFAEIAYFTDEHAANINTRAHIRDYEIPILVHSTLPPEQIISLNDLYVSVYRGEVIIRSARLNKRIIPRLSTAYNHKRSELPVFRFLCDLQYQGLAYNLGFHVENILPGLDYYPRIEFKECILSPAKWLLRKKDLPDPTDKLAYEKFRQLAERRGINRFFALSNADRYLVFDRDDPLAIQLFLSETGNLDEIRLEEFYMPDEKNAVLRNDQEEVFVHQFIASLTCQGTSYTHGGVSPCDLKNIQRDFIPGDEWLYFKIYCAPQNADYLLTRKLYPLIKKCLKKGSIEQWFFIRYDEQGDHLRIRLKGTKEAIREMPGLFNQLLKPLIHSGIITRVLLDTYQREIERYGVKTMESAECSFMYSSELVAVHLDNDPEKQRTVGFAILGADLILNAFAIHLPYRIKLLENICNNLMSEHGHEKLLRDDLNKKYREHQREVRELMSVGQGFLTAAERNKFRTFEKNLCSLNAEFDENEFSRKAKFASDLLHMHMNRIFSTEQRKKELVIYYLCLRYYLSEQARNWIRSNGMNSPVLH